MMDCLFAKCIPCISECVLAELETLGPKYRIALRIARDERFERLPCSHKGIYADDCIVERVTQVTLFLVDLFDKVYAHLRVQHPVYIVATCDKGLKKRVRQVPGIPLMYIAQRKYAIERLPEAYGAKK
jgi:U3 small nucleolar RNA-associated protein 24